MQQRSGPKNLDSPVSVISARMGDGIARMSGERAQRDAPTLEAMKRLAAQYPRYGYRRIRVFLRRESQGMSRHRAHRLWRLAGLQLPVDAPGGALQPHDRGPCRRSAPITSGPTTSYGSPLNAEYVN